MNYQEIYKALETLQRVCDKYEGLCDECPMGNDSGECLVRELYPCNWSLKKPTPVVRIME